MGTFLKSHFITNSERPRFDLSGRLHRYVKNTTYYYQKAIFCQYQKWDCENYLFEDCHLKSGMATWVLALMTSGRSPQKRGLRTSPTTLHLNKVCIADDF